MTPNTPAAPPQPERARVLPSFVTLVAALGIAFVGGCFSAVLFIENGNLPAPLPTGFLIAALAVQQGGLLLALWTVPRAMKDVGPEGLLARVRWAGERMNVFDVLLIGLGMLAVGQLMLRLMSLLWPTAPTGILAAFSGSAQSASDLEFALLLLFGALLPGIAEELTFRGLLQTQAVERWGSLRGVAVTALVFGAFHLDVQQGFMAVFLGIWLGWARLRTSGVVNLAFGHALSNAIGFSITRVPHLDGALQSWWGSAGLAVCLVLAFGGLWFRHRSPSI